MNNRRFRVGQVVAVDSGKGKAGAVEGRYGQVLRYEAVNDKQWRGMYEVALTGTRVLVRWFWPDELRPLSRKEVGQ
jgi:hypothetical protein